MRPDQIWMFPHGCGAGRSACSKHSNRRASRAGPPHHRSRKIT
ncbi:hypothetical protein FM112_06885 [Gulosibacter sp. 10]|nr:hypothetical protein FM112_06885 [Gulosibacter sp. 10]